MAQTVFEQIPAQDWEATPASVRNVLLSLERERNAIREQLERMESVQQSETTEHKNRIQRYQFLVEQQFLNGLTGDEKNEIEQLAREIDSVNASLYPSLSSLSETIARHSGKQPESKML